MILGSISQGDQQFCDVLLRKSRFEAGNNQCFTSSKTSVFYLSRKSSKKLWWNKMQVKEKFKRLSAIHMYITLFCSLILLNNNKIPFKVLLVNEHCLECENFSEAWLGKDSLLKTVYSLWFLRSNQSAQLPGFRIQICSPVSCYFSWHWSLVCFSHLDEAFLAGVLSSMNLLMMMVSDKLDWFMFKGIHSFTVTEKYFTCAFSE